MATGASFRMDLVPLRRAMLGGIAQMGRIQELSESIGEALVASTVQRFEDGRGPDAKAWKPSGRAIMQDGQTLVDTGRLRASIGYEASPEMVAVGTDVEYAPVHQFGLDVDARPYIGINEADLEECRDMATEFARQGFKP